MSPLVALSVMVMYTFKDDEVEAVSSSVSSPPALLNPLPCVQPEMYNVPSSYVIASAVSVESTPSEENVWSHSNCCMVPSMANTTMSVAISSYSRSSRDLLKFPAVAPQPYTMSPSGSYAKS